MVEITQLYVHLTLRPLRQIDKHVHKTYVSSETKLSKQDKQKTTPFVGPKAAAQPSIIFEQTDHILPAATLSTHCTKREGCSACMDNTSFQPLPLFLPPIERSGSSGHSQVWQTQSLCTRFNAVKGLEMLKECDQVLRFREGAEVFFLWFNFAAK